MPYPYRIPNRSAVSRQPSHPCTNAFGRHCRYCWQLTITIGLWRLDAFEFGIEYSDNLGIVLSGEPVGYRLSQQAHPFQLGRRYLINLHAFGLQFSDCLPRLPAAFLALIVPGLQERILNDALLSGRETIPEFLTYNDSNIAINMAGQAGISGIPSFFTSGCL